MKTAIQFNDVLGNIVQLKTAIDTFKQVNNKACWIVESRKIFPQTTKWDNFYPFENQYFITDEEAQSKIKKYLSEYAEIAKKQEKNLQLKEVIL